MPAAPCKPAIQGLVASGLLWFALTLAATALPAAEGGLDQIRDATRSDSSGSSGRDHSGGHGGGRHGGGRHHGHDYDYDDDDVWDPLAALLAEAALYALLSPYWVPVQVCGDDYRNDSRFPPWPYATADANYLLIEGAGDDRTRRRSHPWAVQLTADDSHDFALKINTFRAHLLVDSFFRLGLDTSWAYLHEELAAGATDELGLTDLNVVVRFAQSDAVQMHSGIGMNFLMDGPNSQRGFNFTYRFDIFPVDPLIISVELDAGTLGRAGLFHLRSHLGVVLNRFELFGGYDYLQIGDVEIIGPLAGIRLWF